jgi:hypothetical protein
MASATALTMASDTDLASALDLLFKALMNALFSSDSLIFSSIAPYKS